MAGLLDSIFNSPEGRMGLGLLALGQMPKSQGMPGLMGLLAAQDAAAKNKADSAWQDEARGRQRKEWTQADAAAEAAARQKAAEQQYFFGGGGLLGAGAVGGSSAPAVQGAGAIPAGGADVGAQGGKIDEWARQLGIPRDAIIADYMKNGGKGIADMLYERGKPDMQVTNGYAYDKNKLGSGFMPSLSTSQDGKTSMVRIGQDGLPVVTSPQGALDTYNSYQGAQAAFKPIKVYNPATGREEFTNERAVVQQPQHSGGGYAGGSAGAAAPEQIRIIQTELNRLPADHPDRPALMREIQRIGGGQAAPSGNYAAGPSAEEEAAAAANKARAIATASADVVRDSDGRKKGVMYAENIGNADRAIELLKLGPTASGIGAMADSGAAFFGRATPGAKIAAQLDIISAGMIKNVPRFEGPQSDKDVDQYKAAAGRVADRTLPVEIRTAAAEEVRSLAQKASEQQGKSSPPGGASGGWGEKPKGKVLEALPTANSSNKGQRIRDTTTGKILRSNGMQWKEE